MESFYDIAISILGVLPNEFTFLYSIFAFILGILCISVVFMLFKLVLDIIGVR